MPLESPNPTHKSPLFWVLVIFITGVFLLILIPGFTPQDKGSHRSYRAVFANLKTALDVFETDVGRYPTTAEGFDALLKNSTNDPNWRGPYLNERPIDKWGHPFLYRCPGIDDPTSFDITSAGPDGIFGTKDDINKNTEY
jgi:general secretion pathway protein G